MMQERRQASRQGRNEKEMKEIKDTKKIDIENTKTKKAQYKKNTSAGKNVKSKTEEGKEGRRKE